MTTTESPPVARVRGTARAIAVPSSGERWDVGDDAGRSVSGVPSPSDVLVPVLGCARSTHERDRGDDVPPDDELPSEVPLPFGAARSPPLEGGLALPREGR
jgi:hypothetical protein